MKSDLPPRQTKPRRPRCFRSRRGAVSSTSDLLPKPRLHVVQRPGVISALGYGRRCRVELLFGGAVAALHDFGRHPRVDERRQNQLPAIAAPVVPINNSCAYGPQPLVSVSLLRVSPGTAIRPHAGETRKSSALPTCRRGMPGRARRGCASCAGGFYTP